MVQTAMRAGDVGEVPVAVPTTGGRLRGGWMRGLAYAVVVLLGGGIGVILGIFLALASGLFSFAC